MSRRRAREAAMQAMFQIDLNPPEGDRREAWKAALDAAFSEGEGEMAKKPGSSDYAFSWGLLSGAMEKLAEIDEILSDLSKEWKISRMAGIDRSVLRLAVYELEHGEDVTPGIVINEAVEMAKKYGTDESQRFVNGVLGTMMRERRGEE